MVMAAASCAEPVAVTERKPTPPVALMVFAVTLAVMLNSGVAPSSRR